MSTNNGRLNGKICVVTGSTSGIGKGIALEFALQGAKVLVTGRDVKKAEAVFAEADTLNVPRDRWSFHAADLTDPESCRSIVRRAEEVFGGLDVLVNNAGDFTRGTVENTSLELWEQHMNVNLRAPFLLMQESIPLFKARGGGSVVNIGSVNAYIGGSELFSYSASKGGLMTLSRNAASYLKRYKVRVNVLNVGWTFTEGEDTLQRELMGQDWKERVEGKRPFGRLLYPKDIADAALFFASDESSMVSGSVLDVEQGPVHW